MQTVETTTVSPHSSNALLGAVSWISVQEQKPPTQQIVYVVCENVRYDGKIVRFQTMACYVPPMTVKESDFMAEEFLGEGNYSEELDEYFTPEGWYEWQSEPDMNYKLSVQVTHWIPQLPLP